MTWEKCYSNQTDSKTLHANAVESSDTIDIEYPLSLKRFTLNV